MLEELSSSEVTELLAYDSYFPIGDRGEWVRAAMIATVIANSSRGKKSKVVRMDSFMPTEPKYEGGKRQTLAQMKDTLEGIASRAKRAVRGKEG